tara:strand:- start:36 stop:2921 length:2886 start_codon:yes stop_codon:yes gene_type:complete
MADIRKTFNFRDGVQVDDEVLVVRGSRVGVGTTSPQTKLDVRGNAGVVGVLTANNTIVSGVGTFGGVSLGSTIILDATSGVITASSYKGDGSTLSNLPTSQWTDTAVGAGVSPIYVNGSVGILTDIPHHSLAVGGNPNTGTGVGISSLGDIKVSGIITATTFSGNLVGNVTGDLTGDVTGTASTATLANTATVAVNAQGLTGSPSITVTNINASGVGTVLTLDTTNLEVETVKGFSSLRSPHNATATSIVVTVAAKTAAHRYNGSGSSNAFVLDGTQAPFITLTPGRSYKFDQSNGSNVGHPLRFYYDVDKTTAYTTGVTVSGTAGQAGAFVQLDVTDTTPTVLHYQCQSHGKMGNAVQTNSNVLDTEHNATVRGEVGITSTLTVTGAIDANGGVDISNGLNVTGVTSIANLKVGSVTATAILDEDNLGSNSDTSLATQQSIKAYVDTQVTAQDLDVAGDSGTGAVDLDSQSLTISGTANEIETSASNQTITIGLPNDVTIGAALTVTGNIDANGELDVDGMSNLDDVNISGVGTVTRAFATTLSVSGVSTFTGAIDANGNATIAGTLDVDGTTELDDVNVSSAATISRAVVTALNVSGVTTSTGGFVGNLTGNATGTAGGLSGSPNIIVTNIKSTGISTLGVSTATSLGIGTDTANADIQIHKESAASSIVIGKNSSVGDNNLQLRYGGGASAFSGSEALDLINYGDGNFNYFLTGTSSFVWHKGNADALMALTSTGNLGVGNTNPTDKLAVAGNVNVTGIVTATNGFIGNLTGNSSGLTGNPSITVNSVNTSGISTFRDVVLTGTGAGIGIGVTAGNNSLSACVNAPDRFIISTTGEVGIKTSIGSNIGGGDKPALEVRGIVKFIGGALKVGGQPHTSAITPRAQVDFSDLNTTTSDATSLATTGYMIMPRVTTTQRNALVDGISNNSTLLSGSVIYNTTSNRLELWTGGAWCGIATVV